MTLYAAYGSNMDPAQMLERAPYSPHRGTGWLEGWRLTFGGEDIGWEGAIATVVEDPDHHVFVSIYDLTPQDEESLDIWEGANLDIYSKIRVRVQSLQGELLCYLYVLNSFEGGLPSKRHLSIILDAAIAAGAPVDYLEDLAKRATKDESN